MDKDFVYRQTLVWLEHEVESCNCDKHVDYRRNLAESLTNHLWNNWLQMQRAKRKPEEDLPTIEDLLGSDPDITGGLSTEDYIRQIRGE